MLGDFRWLGESRPRRPPRRASCGGSACPRGAAAPRPRSRSLFPRACSDAALSASRAASKFSARRLSSAIRASTCGRPTTVPVDASRSRPAFTLSIGSSLPPSSESAHPRITLPIPPQSRNSLFVRDGDRLIGTLQGLSSVSSALLQQRSECQGCTETEGVIDRFRELDGFRAEPDGAVHVAELP